MFYDMLRRPRLRRVALKNPVPDLLWAEVTAALPIFDGLTAGEMERLKELAAFFLYEKRFEPARGAVLDPATRLRIAAMASLPLLHLDRDGYPGWISVVVYPGEFSDRRAETDETGVVHEYLEVMGGEAWEQGGIILSLADVEASGWCEGYNVVIHELAHKLDLLTGGINGAPPLRRGMAQSAWHDAMSRAFDDLNRRLDEEAETEIDPYAARNPGEFFAVSSEYFFELPHLLKANYPEVYRQLTLLYGQDPALRLPEEADLPAVE